MGRHTTSGRIAAGGTDDRRRWLWPLLALSAIAILACAYLVWFTAFRGCGDRTSVTVVTDPTMSDTVDAVAGAVPDDECYSFHVERIQASDIPSRVTDTENAPDLWVSDSQERSRRILGQIDQTPEYVSESLATTPTVIAGKSVPELDSWVDVMTLPDLRMGSPVETSTGDSPVVGALTEVQAGKLTQKQLLGALTTLGQQQNNARPAFDTDATRLTTAADGQAPVVTTEQQFLRFTKLHPNSGLQQSMPASGAVLLEFPLVNTARPENRQKAAEAGALLAAAAASDSGRKALSDAGFRAADGTGVGDPVAPLKLADPDQIDTALQQWQVVSVPMRTIVALDGSGSMEQAAGSGTRAQLLSQACLTALQILPNNAQVGGWLFGVDKGGQGQDWDEFAPIRRLDAQDGDQTHRELLGARTKQAMRTRLGGGTGLYDTTLAAFKAVQKNWDPKYSNSVIIMTDGANEDPNGISLDQLLGELKTLQDPARPVIVVTIGISDDADTASLKQIAEATGGTTHVERKASDIRTVLVDAISARVAAAGR
ncbi:substrate-binding domain-containing protein [Gordonia sp. VNK21]|uniref:substrate-binding domain-containing protein n=1 Tax=Gordonia sp. VNK21 TaxID=3382483 RepID=UPI0038D463AD